METITSWDVTIICVIIILHLFHSGFLQPSHWQRRLLHACLWSAALSSLMLVIKTKVRKSTSSLVRVWCEVVVHFWNVTAVFAKKSLGVYRTLISTCRCLIYRNVIASIDRVESHFYCEAEPSVRAVWWKTEATSRVVWDVYFVLQYGLHEGIFMPAVNAQWLISLKLYAENYSNQNTASNLQRLIDLNENF